MSELKLWNYLVKKCKKLNDNNSSSIPRYSKLSQVPGRDLISPFLKVSLSSRFIKDWKKLTIKIFV